MAKSNIAYPPDDLDSLKQKRQIIIEKIDALEKQILEWKEKDSVLAKKIFEREDGRIVKAAKELMSKDADFKAAIDHILTNLDIGGVTKRGRPAKAAPNSTANYIAGKIAAQQQGASTTAKK